MEEKDEKIKKIVDEMFKNKKSNFSLSEREKQIDEFLALLKELWMICPQQRFAQILFNFTKMGTPINKDAGPSMGLKDFFYYEDKDIVENIKKSTESLKKD